MTQDKNNDFELEKETYYFSHDFNARAELQEVLMVLGHEGKSVFWDLIEQLHEQKGYLYLNKIETLAFSSRTTPDLIKTLISQRFGLFMQDKEKFWSTSVLRRIRKREALKIVRSQCGLKGAEARWNQKNKNTPPVKYMKIPDVSLVNLKEKDYRTLLEKYGETKLKMAIEVLDGWLAKGTKVAKQYVGKPHNAHFRKDSWIWERVKELMKQTGTDKPRLDYVN